MTNRSSSSKRSRLDTQHTSAPAASSAAGADSHSEPELPHKPCQRQRAEAPAAAPAAVPAPAAAPDTAPQTPTTQPSSSAQQTPKKPAAASQCKPLPLDQRLQKADKLLEAVMALKKTTQQELDALHVPDDIRPADSCQHPLRFLLTVHGASVFAPCSESQFFSQSDAESNAETPPCATIASVPTFSTVSAPAPVKALAASMDKALHDVRAAQREFWKFVLDNFTLKEAEDNARAYRHLEQAIKMKEAQLHAYILATANIGDWQSLHMPVVRKASAGNRFFFGCARYPVDQCRFHPFGRIAVQYWQKLADVRAAGQNLHKITPPVEKSAGASADHAEDASSGPAPTRFNDYFD